MKERVASRRMPFWGVGVSLSHLNLLPILGTSRDSSPIKSHVREYASPSIGCPVGVIASVNGGAVCVV